MVFPCFSHIYTTYYNKINKVFFGKSSTAGRFWRFFQASFSYDAELRAAGLPARPHLEVVDVVGRPGENPSLLSVESKLECM